ncbi:hypothetical protein AKJ16_DCAP24053 [Drosera capensis]
MLVGSGRCSSSRRDLNWRPTGSELRSRSRAAKPDRRSRKEHDLVVSLHIGPSDPAAATIAGPMTGCCQFPKAQRFLRRRRHRHFSAFNHRRTPISKTPQISFHTHTIPRSRVHNPTSNRSQFHPLH